MSCIPANLTFLKSPMNGWTNDEMGPAVTVFRLCREMELARKHAVTMSEVATAAWGGRRIGWLKTAGRKMIASTFHPAFCEAGCCVTNALKSMIVVNAGVRLLAGLWGKKDEYSAANSCSVLWWKNAVVQ